MVLLALLVSGWLGRRAESAWTACSFPLLAGQPGLEWGPATAANCSRAYLGVDYICDPGALISRTEAQLLDGGLRQHFVPCHCEKRHDRHCRVGLERQGKARFGLALVPLASLRSRAADWAAWQFCPSNLETRRGDWEERVSLFTATLVPRFCPQAELFLTLILDWADEEGRVQQPYPALIPVFSGRLKKLGASTGLNESLLMTRRGSLYPGLRAYTAALSLAMAKTRVERARSESKVTTVQNHKPAHGIPGWAIVLCGVLIGMSLALLLVGNVITTWLPKRALKGGGVSRQSQYARKTAEGGGTQTGQSSSGSGGTFGRTMLFRQFQKRSTAHQPSQPSQAAI